MAGRGTKSTQRARTDVERARLYAARAAWNESMIRRRVRDNTIAVIAGVVLLGAAVASQVVHAQVTASAPEPEPTETVAPTVFENPFTGLFPSVAPAE